MFKQFPREVGPPRKVVYNIKDWLNFVNKYNGMKKAVYTSIYTFQSILPNNKPDYSSALVDKLFFDFDDKSCGAYKECKILNDELIKQDIKHLIVMSGRGYHLYIFTCPLSPSHIKGCIYNAQHYFIDKLNLNCDPQVIGNPAQLARVPNTYNSRANRFCIPINEKQFMAGDKVIKILAENQTFVKDISIGTKLLNIENFDIEIDNTDEFDIDIKFEDSDNANYINNCPDKIKSLLFKKDLNWEERFIVIMYFKEKGFTRKEVHNVLKENLTERKFKHCIAEERQLQYLFSRNDLMLPLRYGIQVYK